MSFFFHVASLYWDTDDTVGQTSAEQDHDRTVHQAHDANVVV